MNTSMMIELVGYLGSALVVVSMLMSSVVKLRLINTVGGILFTAYAVIIRSYPTAIMNFCLILINIYSLMKLLKSSKAYDVTEAGSEESMVSYFLRYYQDDIKIYFPAFRWDSALYDAVYVTYCNAKPAGLMLGRRNGAEIEISLEYTTPEYRDCSAGRYLYERLKEQGICKLKFREQAEKHEGYLQKMGYSKADGAYVCEL